MIINEFTVFLIFSYFFITFFLDIISSLIPSFFLSFILDFFKLVVESFFVVPADVIVLVPDSNSRLWNDGLLLSCKLNIGVDHFTAVAD